MNGTRDFEERDSGNNPLNGPTGMSVHENL